MKLTKLKKNKSTVAPCFAHDYPKNKHKSSSGWSDCKPGVDGLIVKFDTTETQCGGSIITDTQLYEAGYINTNAILQLMDCLRMEDLRRILRRLELPTSENKKCLKNRLWTFLKRE